MHGTKVVLGAYKNTLGKRRAGVTAMFEAVAVSSRTFSLRMSVSHLWVSSSAVKQPKKVAIR